MKYYELDYYCCIFNCIACFVKDLCHFIIVYYHYIVKLKLMYTCHDHFIDKNSFPFNSHCRISLPLQFAFKTLHTASVPAVEMSVRQSHN